MAEREGFEPPDPFESMVFKTTAFDHSASSPKLNCISPALAKRRRYDTRIAAGFNPNSQKKPLSDSITGINRCNNKLDKKSGS